MARGRSTTRRLVLAALAVMLSLMITGWFVIWRSPPFYTGHAVRPLPVPILSMEEYGERIDAHARPYVVRIDDVAGGGGLVLFGATHTKDPRDAQIAGIQRAWEQQRPSVALVEGRLGFLLPGLMDPVEQFGETGAVAALARADGVRLYSWEPPRDVELAGMLLEFPVERVALFYVLRPYFSGLRHGRPDDPDAWIAPYLRERMEWPGLGGALADVSDIDALWTRDFVGFADWRETSDEYGLPGYLAELSSRSNGLRDEHLAQVILDLALRGERVFAIAGSSHAVKLEAALRAAFEAEP